MNRARALEALTRRRFDVLVIGGGITGAGVALDAAARGLAVALVERDDFASGTSSKSSKLVHGGLRYLAQGQVKITLDASREKTLLQTKLAPHLVVDTPFLFPLYGGPLGRLSVGAALWCYDMAAGLPGGRMHARLSAAAALAECPGLDRERLTGAYIYHDARADDCRLVMHVVRKAADLGAVVANRLAVTGFVHHEGRIAGATARDGMTQQPLTIAASHSVNAAGVWCDELRALDDGRSTPAVRPSKGVHLVLRRSRLHHRSAVTMRSPSDGAAVFLVPWGDRTIVGTTDTAYAGNLNDPRAEPADVRALLDRLNAHLPDARLTEADVVCTYAGLRPLVIDHSEMTSRASRDHHIIESRGGLVTITGGKLTTYRLMAKDVVDRLAPHSQCSTDRIPLYAATAPPAGVADDIAEHLLRAYGSESESIARRADASQRLTPGLPYSFAEIDHVVEHEMALTVTDVLARRTRAILMADDHGRSFAEPVALRMQQLLGWDRAEVHRQIAAYERELDTYSVAV
jgi:glycerol-3-phosphate dehydrogenase